MVKIRSWAVLSAVRNTHGVPGDLIKREITSSDRAGGFTGDRFGAKSWEIDRAWMGRVIVKEIPNARSCVSQYVE